MGVAQYELMRGHILDTIDAFADADGSVPLSLLVTSAQDRYATHRLFPKGRVRNDCTFTKVDLEARGEIERIPGRTPQRIRRWTDQCASDGLTGPARGGSNRRGYAPIRPRSGDGGRRGGSGTISRGP